MIYIIFINGSKHSAWDNRKDATKQYKVLVGCGYKSISIVRIEGTIPVNGEYYC